MSYQDFDYDNALNLIKANLFDIYESQERIIGSLEDEEKRQEQITKYIRMKDTAITLIENIEHLYHKNKSEKKEDNNKEVSKIVEVNPVIKSKEESDYERIEDKVENLEEKEEQDEKMEDTNQEKFILDDRNGTKPNFAYVPPDLFGIIKKNGIQVLKPNPLAQVDSSTYYKTDEEPAKGIIVRNDQFIKLSLSKHRQEGVLIDAKKFRTEQAIKSRKRLIKEEEEKLNIKVKSLKVA